MSARTKRRRWFGLLPAKTPPPEPGRFDEAVDFFRRRVPMRKTERSKLGTGARQRGFTVAEVAQLDVINSVWLALDDSIARGATFDEFKKTVTADLVDEWQGRVANPPARIATIFRTNVAQAQNAGRHAQMTTPAILERRPFWQYVDVDDGAYNDRECPICQASHGTILPADDPWWQTSSPPRHPNCRCRLRPLTVAQAESMGITVVPSSIPSVEGFGAPPQERPEPYRVDLSKYPPELAAIAREKMETSA